MIESTAMRENCESTSNGHANEADAINIHIRTHFGNIGEEEAVQDSREEIDKKGQHGTINSSADGSWNEEVSFRPGVFEGLSYRVTLC